jgi:hypothetical protein
MLAAKMGAIEAGRVLGGDTSDSWSATMSCSSAQDTNDDEDLVVNIRDGILALLFGRLYCGIVVRRHSLRNPHGSSTPSSVCRTLLGRNSEERVGGDEEELASGNKERMVVLVGAVIEALMMVV